MWPSGAGHRFSPATILVACGSTQYCGVLWAPKAIRLLISFVGRERVALGSDYPFGFSMWPPLGEEVLGVKMLLHVPGIPTLRGTWRNPIKGLASRTVGGTAGTPVMVEPS